MNRDENTAYLRFHRIFPDGSIQSVQLKIDCRTNQVIARMPINSELPPGHDQNFSEEKFNFNYNSLKLNDSSIRVIKLGGVEDLNPLNYASEISTVLNDPIQVKTSPSSSFVSNNQNNNNNTNLQKRESKVPNIPTMIRCQNCDTNFPTKYQFQRHQCEFNAEKVVLKPNIDAKDVDKGVRMKFDCTTCGKQFVSKNNLERHLTSHDEDNINICEFCNKQFVSENRLRIHKENHCKKAGDILKFYRSDVTVWKCIKCYQVFSSDVYACTHSDNCTEFLNPEEFQSRNIMINENQEEVKFDYVEKVLTELLLQCEYCNKTYADKDSLLLHQNTHTTESNYHCVICLETFESYTLAAKHWLTKCVNEANLFYLPKLTYCSTCERTFKSHEVLYSHKIKKKHYKPKKYVNSEPIETVDLADKEENKETIIKLIEDVLCSIKLNVGEGKEKASEDGGDVVVKSEMMSENSSLSISENVQDGEGSGKKKRGRKRKITAQSSKAKRLANSVDPGFKYQCERCGKVFDRVLDLETHRDTDHTANYKCEECDQVVHSSKALLIHSRAHQRLKPYVCEICKRCYSQTSHLWQHMRFHQGIKPFACPHEGCEARYTIRPDLKDHIRKVHTRERPFKCSVCSKCFLTGSVYYQHRLIHTNDRRYACDICNKRFFRADALNNHRRIHTDERPYPCNVCGRHFRQKGDRNKHVRTQHPDVQI